MVFDPTVQPGPVGQERLVCDLDGRGTGVRLDVVDEQPG